MVASTGRCPSRVGCSVIATSRATSRRSSLGMSKWARVAASTRATGPAVASHTPLASSVDPRSSAARILPISFSQSTRAFFKYSHRSMETIRATTEHSRSGIITIPPFTTGSNTATPSRSSKMAISGSRSPSADPRLSLSRRTLRHRGAAVVAPDRPPSGGASQPLPSVRGIPSRSGRSLLHFYHAHRIPAIRLPALDRQPHGRLRGARVNDADGQPGTCPSPASLGT